MDTQNQQTASDTDAQRRVEQIVSAFFLVTAYRWGARENHSYVIGLFDNEQAAIDAAKQEEEYRGGKYECEVLRMVLTEKWTDQRGEWNKIYGDVDSYDDARKCFHCGHNIEPGDDGR